MNEGDISALDVGSSPIGGAAQDPEVDRYAARCAGLVAGYALRLEDDDWVEAENTSKQAGPFYCPECLAPVQLRNCTERIDHFFHLPANTPVYRRDEKTLHDQCRDEIAAHLQKLLPEGNWKTELTIPKSKNRGTREVVPDICGRFPGNVPVAIEIQHSSYTVGRINRKLEDYHKWGIHTLYIVPLKAELPDQFRPRLFEKYLHALYMGRVYYWREGFGHFVLPVHYSPSFRMMESRTWFDKERGEEVSSEEYALAYKTLRTANQGEMVSIAQALTPRECPGIELQNAFGELPDRRLLLDGLSRWWKDDEYDYLKSKTTQAFYRDHLQRYDPEDSYG